MKSLSLLSLLALTLAGCGPEKPAPAAGPAVPAIRDGSMMVPGKPQLTALPEAVAAGPQTVTWNMWWGENGRQWTLYVNGVGASSGSLKSASPKQQQASAELALETPGSYEIKVALCNDHGCSESEPRVVQVNAG